MSLTRERGDHSVVQWSSFSPEPCVYDGDGQVLPSALDCRYDHLFRPLDRHRYLRDEGELVLVDERGRGALVRAWMTTGDGFSADFAQGLRIRVRLDEDPIPFLDVELDDWFGGITSPFQWPLVGNRHNAAGAGFSLVPIVFNQRLRISLAGPDTAIDANRIWYQFNVHRVAAHSAVGPSGLPGDIQSLHNFVSTPAGQYPWPTALTWQAGSHVLADGANLTLLDRQQGDTILALRLRVDTPAHWQTIRLVMQLDGERTLDHPLAAWFGLGEHAAQSPRALLVGRDAEGFAYLYWPMPFHQSAHISLVQPAGAGAAIVDYAVAYVGQPPPSDALRFGLSVRDQCLPAGRQHPDLDLVELTGRGRWLGLSTMHHNQSLDHSNYLEGDDRIHVDGSAHPVWYGTGNEDFYNAGFYFDRGGYGYPLSLPISGAPWHQLLAGTPVASQMYRLLLTDAIPFRSRLRVGLERGAYGDQAMCAKTTAWYYHEPLRALAPLAELELSSPDSVAAAAYEAPASALCDTLTAAYADEPPTQRAGRVCRFTEGSSTFRFRLDHAVQQLWLRRRFDGYDGGQAARILVDGVEVGMLSYAQRHAYRRWQEVDMPLALPPQPAGAELQIRVIPLDADTPFTEAAYTLIGTVGDALFANGFQSPP